MNWKRLGEIARHWLLPKICVHCGEDLPRGAKDLGELLCPSCAGALVPAEAPFCRRCAAPLLGPTPDCDGCLGEKFSCALIRSAFFYRGPASSIVRAFKYRGRRHAAKIAGERMARELSRFLELGRFDGVVPMPLHPKRERERSYNQARILAEEISAATGIPLFEPLARRFSTQPQWSLSRKRRRDNVAGAFRASIPCPGKNLLLIDDVCTSSASLEECARVLRLAGAARVCGYVFARQGQC